MLVIGDLHKLSLTLIPFKLITRLLRIFQIIYMGRTFRTIVTNVTTGTYVLYKIITPFLSKGTRDKTVFYRKPNPK